MTDWFNVISGFHAMLHELDDGKIGPRDVLTSDWISQRTPYKDLDALFAAAGVTIDAQGRLVYETSDLDAFISQHTPFSTWNQLFEGAMREWLAKKLGLL